MANNLTYIQTYVRRILDEVYKESSKSAVLDLDSSLVREIQGTPGAVQIPMVTLSGGLADYNKTTGAVAGDVNLAWQNFQLTKDRARKFTIDAVDNLETAGIALANLASVFLREYVVPEVDAYRFSVYATKAKTKVASDLTASTIEAAISTAITTLAEAEVPKERLILFMNPTSYGLLKDAVKANRLVTGETVTLGIANYDGLPVIDVPSSRFNSSVTLTSTGGFTLAGQTINFLLMDRAAAVQVVKHNPSKLFTPDENIDTDGYLWRYRLYHDAFVPQNKAAGIYVHTAAAQSDDNEDGGGTE